MEMEQLIQSLVPGPICLRKEQVEVQPKGAWLGIQCSAAVQGGDADGLYKLGVCNELGIGMPRDLGHAVELYINAVEMGSIPARCQLGLCYQSGRGIHRDIAEAIYLFSEAANQGSARGMALLGERYNLGEGVIRDHSQGFAMSRSAAERNDPDGLAVLARCYFFGAGVSRDKDKALELWRRGAAQGHPGCLRSIAACYSRDSAYSFPERIAADEREALQLFRLAALQGDPDATAVIARFLLNGWGGLERNVERAVALAQSAAAYGSLTAAELLARCYTHGVGVLRDIAQAAKWRSIGAEMKGNVSRNGLKALYESNSPNSIDNFPTDPIDATRTCCQLIAVNPQLTPTVEEHLERLIDDNLVCKLAVCGMSGSGKTTLVASLKASLTEHTSTIDTPLEARTAGIEMSTLPLSKTNGGASKSVIVLDLAGHKEWHISHEYFVQFESGGFLLLCDLSGDPVTEESNLWFWLRFINTLMVRKLSEYRSNVIIVGSHADIATDPFMAQLGVDKATYQSPWGKGIISKAKHQFSKHMEIRDTFHCVDCRQPANEALHVIQENLQRYRLHAIANSFDYLHKSSSELDMESYYDVVRQLKEQLNLPRLSLVKISVFQAKAKELNRPWARNSFTLRKFLKVVTMLGKAQYFDVSGWLVTEPCWLAHDVLERVLGPKIWKTSTLQQVAVLGHVGRLEFEAKMIDVVTDHCNITDLIDLLRDLNLFFDDQSLVGDALVMMFHSILKEQRPSTVWELDSFNFASEKHARLTPKAKNCLVMPSVIPRVQVAILREHEPPNVVLWSNAVMITVWSEESQALATTQALVEIAEDLTSIHIRVRQQLRSESPQKQHKNSIKAKLRNVFRGKTEPEVTDDSLERAVTSLLDIIQSCWSKDFFVADQSDVPQGSDRPQLSQTLRSLMNHEDQYTGDASEWTSPRRNLWLFSSEVFSLKHIPMAQDSTAFLSQCQPSITLTRAPHATTMLNSTVSMLAEEFSNFQRPDDFLYPQWEMEEFVPFADDSLKILQTLKARQWRHETVRHVFSKYPAIQCKEIGVRLQPVFIGAPTRAVAEKICASGFPTKKFRTAGWYGAGVYCTMDLEYAYYYANGAQSTQRSDSPPCVIVALAAFANPLPVIEHPHGAPTEGLTAVGTDDEGNPSFYGQPQQIGHDCHIAVVKRHAKYGDGTSLAPLPPDQWSTSGVWTELVMMDRRAIAPYAILDFDKHVDPLAWCNEPPTS